MTKLADLQALLAADDHDLAGLRSCLLRIGFDDQVLAAAESVASGLVDALRLPLVHAHLLASERPSWLAAALWLYRATLTAEHSAALFHPKEREILAKLGLIEEDNGYAIRATVRITPFDGLYIIADDIATDRAAVMSPSTTTLALSRMLGDLSGQRVLDLGCGPGTIALLAARRGAQTVTGSDLSARAITLAQVNARLNQIDAEFIVSDLFVELKDRRFDRIFAQPPYVLHPSTSELATFMHGGPRGDAILRPLVAQTIEYLTPAGRAVYSFHLPLCADQSPLLVIEEWLASAPIDLALWTTNAPSPAVQAIAYASMYARHFDQAYAREAQGYSDHLRHLQITHFVSCYAVLLPRRDDEPRRFHGSLRRDPGQFTDEEWLERSLIAWQAASAPLPELAQARLRVPAGLILAEEIELAVADESQWHARFPSHSPFYDCELSNASAALLRLFGQPVALRQAVEHYAQLCQASPREVAQQVVDFVRHGLVRGLFVVEPSES